MEPLDLYILPTWQRNLLNICCTKMHWSMGSISTSNFSEKLFDRITYLLLVRIFITLKLFLQPVQIPVHRFTLLFTNKHHLNSLLMIEHFKCYHSNLFPFHVSQSWKISKTKTSYSLSHTHTHTSTCTLHTRV